MLNDYIPPTAIEYNENEILGKYDTYLTENVERAYIEKINKKRYMYRIDNYIFHIILRENINHTYLEVFDTEHKEFIIRGIIKSSKIRERLQQDNIFYKKALNDNAFNKLGIDVDDSTDGKDEEVDNV